MGGHKFSLIIFPYHFFFALHMCWHQGCVRNRKKPYLRFFTVPVRKTADRKLEIENMTVQKPYVKPYRKNRIWPKQKYGFIVLNDREVLYAKSSLTCPN